MVFGNLDTDTNVPTDSSKQVYNIKDLSTKSVTLYSTRAHVTREINDVRLRPGANEVEIYGLSPTVDEHSIQIEGQGNATIVDLTVELVPNRDIFEEVYPEDSEDSDTESEDDPGDSEVEEDAVKKISEELKKLKLQVTEATETQNSANERLATWDRYAKTANAQHLSPDEIAELLHKYEQDRAKIFKIHEEATQKVTDLKKQIKRRELEKERAGKDAKKQKAKIEKQKAKERRKKELKKNEKRKEAKYLKQERLRYWAKKVYKITLLLESSSLDTPGSSRRNSLDSVTLASSPLPDAKTAKGTDASSIASQPVSLLLSYVTKEAGWSPRYDLRISSVQKTATIIYRTEFLNRTSEIWKDAKVSFSTSQTSYQGLDDVVPFMHAWRIKLSRYDSGDGGLLSPEEAYKPRAGRPGWDIFNRAEVFGLDDNFIPSWQSKRPLQIQQASNTGGLFGSKQSKPAAGGLFGASSFGQQDTSNTGGGVFGSNNNNNQTSLFASSHAPVQAQAAMALPPPPPPPPGNNIEPRIYRAEAGNTEIEVGIQAARSKRSSKLGSSFFGGRKKENNLNDDDTSNVYDPTIEDLDEDVEHTSDPLDFEETSWEDNGLTATYDVPGTRTLEPSSLTRRHKIASLHASNIHLSHICVPKLRSAAFLRAKIRNPSNSVTLLKGSAGVTLDGSFLGNMNLPRVSPNQIFDLPLGVDPAIHVNYPKPNVHRSTQGIIFNKESAQVFTRSIWLNNTKPSLVDLLVLDQIPVSEDERLRIGIMTPRGLAKEGDSVKAGVPAKEGKSEEKWGSAVAKLKKGGEVGWTVKLEGGKGCLLKLEYEARLPPSEKITPA